MFGQRDNLTNNQAGMQDQGLNQLVTELSQPASTSDSSLASTTQSTTNIATADDQSMANDIPTETSVSQTNFQTDQSVSNVSNFLPNEVADKPVDLIDLKSKALDELYPIIHKLDLSAEENFKTLMMMIQATDNHELISQAYEAAEKIEDEATKARALLDIVNEINYFTNHPSIDQ